MNKLKFSVPPINQNSSVCVCVSLSRSFFLSYPSHSFLLSKSYFNILISAMPKSNNNGNILAQQQKLLFYNLIKLLSWVVWHGRKGFSMPGWSGRRNGWFGDGWRREYCAAGWNCRLFLNLDMADRLYGLYSDVDFGFACIRKTGWGLNECLESRMWCGMNESPLIFTS